MGSPLVRGWKEERANRPAARLSCHGEAVPALPSHQPPAAACTSALHGGKQAFLTLPSDTRQGGNDPRFFGFFLGVSSFKSMHPASHSALPALSPRHALWGIGHQAGLSCAERSLGVATHGCRSPLSLLLRSGGVRKPKCQCSETARSFAVCWHSVRNGLLVYKWFLEEMTHPHSQGCFSWISSPWLPGTLVLHIQSNQCLRCQAPIPP